MLRPSFVPPKPIQKLCDLTRYRAALVAAASAEKNRVEKLLEDAQIKLSVVATDSFAISGRAMMAALIAGQRDPTTLAQMARTRMRAKIPQLEEAFVGHFKDHHAFLLSQMPDRIDGFDVAITRVKERIDAEIAPFAEMVSRLDEIPGVGVTAAHVIIAEVGIDMARFPTRGTCARGPGSRPESRHPPVARRATARPATATATWPPCWARQQSQQPRPTPSSANAPDGSRDDEARRRPPSRSAAPSWSSSGTCCPTPRPASSTWARTSATRAWALNAPSVTTSAGSKTSGIEELSNPQPDRTQPHKPGWAPSISS